MSRMAEERKPHFFAWAANGLLCLPWRYFALLWPTCWLADREIIPSAEIYRPLARVAARRPGKVRDVYSAYARWGAKKGNVDTVGHKMLLEEWRKCHPPAD
jgi:hypothetical protein